MIAIKSGEQFQKVGHIKHKDVGHIQIQPVATFSEAHLPTYTNTDGHTATLHTFSSMKFNYEQKMLNRHNSLKGSKMRCKYVWYYAFCHTTMVQC